MIDPRIAGVGAVLGAVLLFGSFALLFSHPGVAVECNEQNEITGFDKTTPPAFAAIQAHYCDVEGYVDTLDGNERVCEFGGAVRGGNEEVFRCDGLSEYEGSELRIEATFYDPNSGDEIGQDVFTGIYSP